MQFQQYSPSGRRAHRTVDKRTYARQRRIHYRTCRHRPSGTAGIQLRNTLHGDSDDAARNIQRSPLRTILQAPCKNVWSIRVRTNLFDEHTVNETRIMVALIVQVCVCESLLGVTWMTSHGYTFTSGGLAATAAIGTLITGLYYVAQIVVYRIVGYAFTSRLLCIQWIQGLQLHPDPFGLRPARAYYPYISFLSVGI